MGALLNLERERLRQAQLKTKGNSKYWRPEKGEGNVIRVLMFQHKATAEDAAAGLYEKKEVGKTFWEWSFPFIIHYKLHPKYPKAPVRSTPEIMALYEKYKKSKDKDEQAIATDIKPVYKYAMNIVDINAPDKGVQIYHAPKTVREFIGDHVNSEHYGEGILGVKGQDWQISYDPDSKDPKTIYKVKILPEKVSRAMSSKVEKMVFDLFDPEVNRDFADIMDVDDLDVPEAGVSAPQDNLEGKDPEPEQEKPANGKKGGVFSGIYDEE